jgi:hypothetical protein
MRLIYIFCSTSGLSASLMGLCFLWPHCSSGSRPRQPAFESVPAHVGFVVDRAALGQVFSEYSGFPCQSFYRLNTAAVLFEPGSYRVGFMVDKLALGQLSSEYFVFPCHSFHRPLHTHHLPSGSGAIGQTVAEVPSNSVSSHLQEKIRKKITFFPR